MENKEKVTGLFRDPKINENNNLYIFEDLLGKCSNVWFKHVYVCMCMYT